MTLARASKIASGPNLFGGEGPELAHHAWGPSSLKQKINCLASDQATRGLPDTDSIDSLSGTATHHMVEYCREHDVPASDFLGKTLYVDRVDGAVQEFEVDQARVDSAQTFIDHINSLPGIDFNEQRIRYGAYIPGGFGTLDAARGNDGTVYLRDFKDGKLIVWAKDNEQLLGQALGFLEDWGHLFEIKKFNLGIVQPRRDHIDIWEVDADYVREWGALVLMPAYERAQQPNPPFAAGDWCTFCKIRGMCKARAASVFTDLVGEFEDLGDALEKVEALPLASEQVKTYLAGDEGGPLLDNDGVARILPLIPNIKAWCKDIERYAFNEVVARRAVGDYKIVEGKSNRTWAPGAEAKLREAAEALDPTGVNADVILDSLYEPRELKGPAKVEKILGAKRFKPATEKKPAGDLHDLVTKPRGRPALVPGSDARPPMDLDGASVFDEVDDDDFG